MPRQIMIVDDDPDVLAGLELLLTNLEWEVTTASTGREALRKFDTTAPDVVLLDVMLPDLSGIEVLEHIKSVSESTPVIMMSGVGTVDAAVAAMRKGAEHFLPKPCDVDNLELILEQASKAVAMRRELAELRRPKNGDSAALVGISTAVQQLNSLLPKVAKVPSPVLLQGESGSGKGVVARAIHQLSGRAKGPYIDLNCAGLSRELLESELFGHERGAFTGAQTAKPGLFEIAAEGTLFLDEIGEIEPSIQARLLKVLEEKKFRRVGGLRDIHVDVRLIAATNRNLEKEVAEKRFRAELFYRLNVVTITLPPLRVRGEDLPLLAEVIMDRLSRELGLPRPVLSRRAMQSLLNYSWPGNIRELRNILERALLVSDGKEIRAENLALGTMARRSAETSEKMMMPDSLHDVRPLEDVVSGYIARVTELTGGNMRKAARLLGISPSTLYARSRKDLPASD